jgi:hypothetical protein
MLLLEIHWLLTLLLMYTLLGQWLHTRKIVDINDIVAIPRATLSYHIKIE